MESSQALHRQLLEKEGNPNVYDPDQPAAERREIRRGYRNLQRKLDESKSEYLRPDNNGLLETFQEANSLFKNVKQTSDATLDSRLLVAASDLTLKKVSNLVVGSTGVGIDIDEFVGKCISFMRAGDRQARDDDQDDHDDGGMDWAYLGRTTAFKGTKRPATGDFLLGPLSVQKKIRVQKAKRMGLKRKAGEQATKPVDVQADEIRQSENNTLKLVQKVFQVIKTHLEERVAADEDDDKVNLFEVVINPESFGQTVENIFFVSFLAREGKIAVYEDEETGLPMLELANPATAEQRDAGEAIRQQMIFSLTMLDWKQAVEVFDITDPVIPTREKEITTIGATGWYT